MQAPASGFRFLQSSRFWFLLFVGSVCAWVLSLPLFPAQDSPMHRYYAHALGAVLAHDPHYSGYAVRHPFPPYATQYISLLALFHVFSYDWAEKIFTCLEIVCFAAGLRWCATAVGPSGQWVSLLTGPLLLPWYLLMGFFNYSVGLGLALFAAGFWLRLHRNRWAAAGYGLSTLLLVFSHPVPVLILLVFIMLDLARRRFSAAPADGQSPKLRLAAAGYTVCLALYPSLAIDNSRTASTLSDIGFHASFARTVLLLTGMSPYNTRSHGVWINGYRLAVYALLFLSLLWGWRAVRANRPERGLAPSTAFFTYAFGFAVLLPWLPDRLNGGVFFATRMVILVWVFAMLAASGLEKFGPGLPRVCVGLGALFTVLTLVPAERTLRPLALSLARMESVPLPPHAEALVLTGPLFTAELRIENDLAFNPFLWAHMLPLNAHEDLVLNAPWLDLSISPLRASNDAPLLVGATGLLDKMSADPPLRFDTLVPPEKAHLLIQGSGIVMYAGTDHELADGLVDFLGEQDAARFICRREQAWSLVCLRQPEPAHP